jgi:hypothetical protein
MAMLLPKTQLKRDRSSPD